MSLSMIGPPMRQWAQRAAFVILGVCLVAMAVAALRLTKARGEVANLKLGISGRQARLTENRKVAATAPKVPMPDALDRSRAVSRLRATLNALASKSGFSLDEFQASTEETPYLTVYASENKDPGWMQVTVRVLLRGRSTVLASAISSLRDLEVPFEIDNLEVTRRSTDEKGNATVTEQVQLRVLVYRGEP